MKTQYKLDESGSLTLGMFAVAFTVLKLTGVIDWSWVWILAPLWIPFAIAAIVIGTSMLVHILKNRKY